MLNILCYQVFLMKLVSLSSYGPILSPYRFALSRDRCNLGHLFSSELLFSRGEINCHPKTAFKLVPLSNRTVSISIPWKTVNENNVRINVKILESENFNSLRRMAPKNSFLLDPGSWRVNPQAVGWDLWVPFSLIHFQEDIL